jgi:hypothetical protein
VGTGIEEISRAVVFAYSGRRFGYFLKDGKQYQVIAQMSLLGSVSLLGLVSLFGLVPAI